MTDLFPIIQPEAEPTVQEKLPLCREVAWDFARGIPIYAVSYTHPTLPTILRV